MNTELTPEQLTNLIRYWVENIGTNYQKRLKPLMTPDEAAALAKYIIENQNSIINYPPAVVCIVPLPCPHARIEDTQELHWVRCLDCGEEWCDVQG